MIHRTIATVCALGLTTLVCVPGASAQETAGATDRETTSTRVSVHVVARDAKLIGSSVGGAEVVVRDAATGEELARGVHAGGTGDTGLIMGSRARNVDVFTTRGAAGYTAELALAEPRMVRIEASGPLDYPAARATAGVTLLVVPGGHVDGDGVVLELWGYIVELVEAPETVAAREEFDVLARVRMLCSCPTEPGGLWEAGDVTARLRAPDGRVVSEAVLGFTGATSEYAGRLMAPEAGDYELEVTAASAETGNAGRRAAPMRVE